MERLKVACVVAVVAVALAGCSSSTSTMPNVTGKRLDVAYSSLADAGVDKSDVEVIGGGLFGVVVEANWTVCSQSPAAGEAVSDVELVVDRSCGGAAAIDSDTDSGTTDQGGSDVGTFAMPDLVGMVLQDAQDLLQSKGSYLLDQQDASGQGRFQVLDSNWQVCSQSPPPGAQASAETLVTLSAVKLDESCP